MLKTYKKEIPHQVRNDTFFVIKHTYFEIPKAIGMTKCDFKIKQIIKKDCPLRRFFSGSTIFSGR
jgi:hypothetical protein